MKVSQLSAVAAGFRTYVACENPLFGPDVSPDFTFVWLKDCDPIIRKDIEHIPNTQALKGDKAKRNRIFFFLCIHSC